MPSLQLTTNVKISDVKAFVLEFSKLAAETLQKPEKYITVTYTYNEFLSFNGNFGPAFAMTIYSLDNLSPQANDSYSDTFFSYLETTLNVPGNRGYITFIDPGRAYMGHEGTTFQKIFGGK